jgi:hypothetical protein
VEKFIEQRAEGGDMYHLPELLDDYPIIVAVLFLALGLIPAFVWVRNRWLKLKPELFPDAGKSVADNASQHAQIAGPERVTAILARAKAMLEKEKQPEAQTGVAVLAKLQGLSGESAMAIHTLLAHALDTADLSSLLLGRGGLYAFVVVVPNRHEHAHLLRRYPAFSAGWRYHAEVVRASLIASGDFSGLAAILFFLSPEGGESTLLVSCADRNRMLLPAALAQGEDRKAANVATYDGSVNFSLTE